MGSLNLAEVWLDSSWTIYVLGNFILAELSAQRLFITVFKVNVLLQWLFC